MDTVLKTKITDLLMQEAHYNIDSKYRLTITLFLQKNSTIDIWEGPKYNLESIKTQVQIFCKKVQNLLEMPQNILTHFWPLFLFYTIWRYQKTKGKNIGWKWVNKAFKGIER